MMALDKDGELWSWGSGMFGETGLGEFQHSLVPKKVKINFNQKHMIIDDLLLQNRKGTFARTIQTRRFGTSRWADTTACCSPRKGTSTRAGRPSTASWASRGTRTRTSFSW